MYVHIVAVHICCTFMACCRCLMFLEVACFKNPNCDCRFLKLSRRRWYFCKTLNNCDCLWPKSSKHFRALAILTRTIWWSVTLHFMISMKSWCSSSLCNFQLNNKVYQMVYCQPYLTFSKL